MMPKYAFCHGWTVDARKGFNEVTCRYRERCAYYDVNFYRHHGHHLDDFEEMFPMEPCQFYIAKENDVYESVNQNDFLSIGTNEW